MRLPSFYTLVPRRRRRLLIVPLAILALLLAVRAVLPIFVTDFVNRKINAIPNFQGSVDDVDLHLWRGAYTIHGLDLRAIENGKTIPVVSAPKVLISVEWRALLRGNLVGEIEFYRPQVNVVTGAAKKEGRSADDFIERLRELTPLRVNRFGVIDGELHFRNFAAHPDVDIYLDHVQLVAHNLTNSDRVSDSLVATIEGDARAMRSGELTLKMKIDPFAKRPTFDLAFELKDLRLPELNSFLKHYLSVSARDGWISLYVECTARDGGFQGYVKPLTRDLDILSIKEEKKGPIEMVKGFFVKIVADIFENKSKDQLATKVEFSGRFENPDISIWEAVASFLRNAFVRALEPGLEGSLAPEQAEEAERESKD